VFFYLFTLTISLCTEIRRSRRHCNQRGIQRRGQDCDKST